MSEEKLLFKESYENGEAMLRPELLPTMRNMPSSVTVDSAEVKEAGIIERDGQPLEYQIVRVVYRPVKSREKSA